ncbi:MAG TPA: hypothetical protein VMW75_06305 [Thermoanaerobaculia bacterium]|nr:hypothetical protein [Thermoanaerobaculia bacterium]
MADALSLDPFFLDRRRSLVAAGAGRRVAALDQASARHLGAGRWELRLRFVAPLPSGLAPENLRLVPVRGRAGDGNAPAAPGTAAGGFAVLTVHPDPEDDRSWLAELANPTDPAALLRGTPQWAVELVGLPAADPLLNRARFNLLVATPANLPPAAPAPAAPLPTAAPAIDYLAKDYASFRQQMLDDIALWLPDLPNDSVAAQNVALVELLAFAGDYLSYYQDAVGTEAYLGTARRRVSVARHAQLLDYWISEGTNSRTWVKILIAADTPAGAVLPAGTALLTAVPGMPAVRVTELADLDEAVSRGARIFETLEDLDVGIDLQEPQIHDWGLPDFSIPAGSTTAALRCQSPRLAPGRALLLASRQRPQDQHVVRLTSAEPGRDPVTRDAITSLGWAAEDALPFDLPVTARGPEGRPLRLSTACTNVVLADFGATWPLAVPAAATRPRVHLPRVPRSGSYRPRLPQKGMIFRVPFSQAAAGSAAAALRQDPARAMPAIRLWQSTLDGRQVPWQVRRQLLASGRFAPDYVVEIEDGREAWLRFGDGWQGQLPAPGSRFSALYRIACGQPNVGKGALKHVVTDLPWVVGVESPFAAAGAIPPERTRRAALFAPHAYQGQARCVTAADYVAALAAHPEVLHAAVELLSTGSWPTVFAYVQRRGGLPLDAPLRAALLAELAARRVAGSEVALLDARYLAVCAAFQVTVAPQASRDAVEQALWQAFGTGELPGGGRGFFAAESFTFGQPLYLGRMVATAAAVAGVTAVAPIHFATWGQPAGSQLAAGVIVPQPYQVIRLLNDPDQPGEGTLRFAMEGGW